MKDLLKVIKEAKTLREVQQYAKIEFEILPIFLDLINKNVGMHIFDLKGESIKNGYGVLLNVEKSKKLWESIKNTLNFADTIGSGVYFFRRQGDKYEDYNFQPILIIEDKEEAFLTAKQNDQTYIIDLKTNKKLKTMR